MENINHLYRFILELDKLKLVFRNTTTEFDRKESTAEHSWSVAMIVITLMKQLREEFGDIDELKTIKLALTHDIVEIYAGDVMAFDEAARKDKEKIELQALHDLMAVNPAFAQELHDLWHEFEDKQTIEAKIAKAADAICPIFQRLQSKQSYIPFNLTIANLEKTKYPIFMFSKTFITLYEKLKHDLLSEKLITQ
jgi:putative hydrolase of HD superfamily